MEPRPELHNLSDLSVLGANDTSVPYIGYVVLDISVPFIDSSVVPAPVLIVSNTRYSESVPLIVGTNVIRFLKNTSSSGKIESPWEEAFSSLSNIQVVPVRSNLKKSVTLQPHTQI